MKILLTLAFIILVSCQNNLDKGYLVGKKHIPEQILFYYDVVFEMPMIKHQNEIYRLYFAYGNETRSLDVSKKVFDSVEIGKLYYEINQITIK
ncbi:hypothetical protein ACQ1PF_07910 [Ornithobacterium rhinotracheale]